MTESYIEILLLEKDDRAFSQISELIEEVNQYTRAFGSAAGVSRLSIKRALSIENGLRVLRSGSSALILVDGSMLSERLDLLEGLQRRARQIPIIVLSTEEDLKLSISLLRAGVQDFLVKRQLTVATLGRALFFALERAGVRRYLSSESQNKSEFLARMSHEIRTPITAIVGFAEVLIESQVSPEERLNAAQTILRNSKFLMGLIDDILDFSRIESGKFELNLERVSLFDVLADVEGLIRPKAEAKELQFRIQMLYPLPQFIRTDAIRLQQVLINLVGNAVKFTEKGIVTVSVHWVSGTQQLVFHVKDSGIGIERSKIDALFDPFVQARASIRRQYGGTGLGLAIARSLVEALGGEISATSQLGVGSDFSFVVDVGPIAPEILVHSEPQVRAVQIEGAKEPLGEFSGFKGCVLVAEDVKDTQDLIALYCARLGLNCEVVTNGAEATQRASEKEYDLILMDMQMPVMDGFEAVRWLRSNGYRKPILALTANPTEEIRADCLAAGCTDHLTKPFSKDAFLAKISKYISRVSTKNLESQLETVRTDPSFVALVDRFRAGLPDRLLALNEAWQRSEYSLVKDLAHRLASADMFGFSEITELAKKLESASSDLELTDIEELLVALSNAVAAAVNVGQNNLRSVD